jgi:hypothetical protein
MVARVSKQPISLRGLEWGAYHFSFDYDYVPKSRPFEATVPGKVVTNFILSHAREIESIVTDIEKTLPKYRLIGARAETELDPYWANGWLPATDGVMIYGLLASRHPKRYLEVGSGNSTKFARRAIRDFGLGTQIISIDPAPRAEINQLCDTVIRRPVEDVDLEPLIGQLESGDIVFIDNSHRSFQNSDVTVCILEFIPQLPRGVIYGVHDIYLPFDYDPCHLNYYYNEQYLLAAYLLGGGLGDRVAMPVYYGIRSSELGPKIARLYCESIPRETWDGSSFWLTRA